MTMADSSAPRDDLRETVEKARAAITGGLDADTLNMRWAATVLTVGDLRSLCDAVTRLTEERAWFDAHPARFDMMQLLTYQENLKADLARVTAERDAQVDVTLGLQVDLARRAMETQELRSENARPLRETRA